MVALGICLICITAFSWRDYVSGDAEFLDARQPSFSTIYQSYTRQDVIDLFAKLKKTNSLRLYQITEVTLDLVFPIAYMLIFVGILYWLKPQIFGLIMYLPVLMAAVDILENLSIFFLIQVYSVSGEELVSSTFVMFASLMTSVKWVVFWLIFVAIIFFTIHRMIRLKIIRPESDVVG